MSTQPRSWKPEVQTDASGNWYDNALRFATEAEAKANADNLMMRWILVHKTRASPSEDEPNYKWENGRLTEIENGAG